MPADRLALVAGVVGLAAAACVTGVSAKAARGASRVSDVAHVVVVVFENREETAVVGNKFAPTFNEYARRYVSFADYTAVAHPSLPNYLALVSGSTHGITEDCDTCGPWRRSVGGLLTRAGKSWGGFAEGFPSSALFAKRHMPFLYFRDGASNVQPLSKLDDRRLPSYAFVAPNVCHDGHNCSIATADAFLAHWLPPLLRAAHTAVFVVFDEGTSDVGGGGRVAAFAAGTAVKRRGVVQRHVDHYTVLRTVEYLFGLPLLGQTATERPLGGIFR